MNRNSLQLLLDRQAVDQENQIRRYSCRSTTVSVLLQQENVGSQLTKEEKEKQMEVALKEFGNT